jgi:hypothetical protein
VLIKTLREHSGPVAVCYVLETSRGRMLVSSGWGSRVGAVF